MEFLDESNRNQKKIEQLILILYGGYNIVMCIDMLRRSGSIAMVIAMIIGMFIAWGVKVANVRTIHFRANVTALMMEISIVLYAVHLQDITKALPWVAVVMVIVAFYSIPEIMLFSFVGTMFIYFHYYFISHLIPMATRSDVFYNILSMGNVFVLEYLVYYLDKKRQEGNVQLFRIIDALQQAERSKDDFLSNVSHEIRTPINTICGMSELVQGEEDPRKMRNALFDIQQAGRNLLSVVSDILDFSELQSGKMEIEEEEYNISSTINDVINMSLARKKQKNIELIVDCDADIPRGLLGDEKKLRRVIMNLVNNAIKFTNDGCVAIRIACRREEYGINLVITVKDTGIGMDAESMEKLFTSFSQVDTRRNRQEGGIGLGLAISQALVECMGGVITIRSKPGKGSVVQVVVPQKVTNPRPVAQLEKKDELNVAIYVDMEQFGMVTIRDEYVDSIRHMVEQLQVKCHICRNLAELKRRIEQETFTHIIASMAEYEEDRPLFDALSERIPTIIILNREDDDELTNLNIMRIYKPFYILPIVNTINKGNQVMLRSGHYRKFVAPQASVLVVDDNLINIQVIEGLLEKYQIKVVRAMSGHEALEKIESKEFDFVFMDHMMPEMDGIETFHRIRAKAGNYFQKVPIVALTANAIAGSREKFMEEGFNDFVEKPVEVSVLERVLLRTLRQEHIQYIDQSEQEGGTSEPDGRGVDKMVSGGNAVDAASDVFMIGDLDVEKGIMYCGGREKYLNILADCYESSAGTGEYIERCYREEDWEKYVIAVHGLKGSMMGGGAVSLSNQAKELELAGKAEDIELIRGRHDGMMAEYRRVMREVAEDSKVDTAGRVGIEQIELSAKWDSEADLSAEETAETPEERAERIAALPELSESEFGLMHQELEDAAYGLDGEEMQEILEEFSRYRYRDKALQDVLKPVFYKVEMCEYVSALGDVETIWKTLQEEGGASDAKETV